MKALLKNYYSNAVKVVIIEDCIKHFAFLCQDAVTVDQYPREASRRKELVEQGYIVGKSYGHGCILLADYVLQFLLHEGVLKGPDNTLALEKWRHDMCQQVRKHLNEDVDEALRPRERNDSQVVLDVPDDVHASAFLQLHRHSQAIIKFFVANLEFPRYVRVLFFLELMV